MLLPCRQRLLHAACLASEQARAGSLGGYRDGITYVDTFATMQICQPNINGTPCALHPCLTAASCVMVAFDDKTQT
jgi:hypothetical protein